MRWGRTLAKVGAIVVAAVVAVLVLLALRPADGGSEAGPAAGECWAGVDPVRVACTEPHRLETVAVGEVGSVLAGRAEPPARSELGAEYAECGRTAERYLGADWRTLHVQLIITAPPREQWQQGRRWYRCDAITLGDELDPVADRRGSMRGNPDGSGPAPDLQLGCATHVVVLNAFIGTRRLPCTDPHDMEFVGIAESDWPDFPATADAVSGAFAVECKARAQTYTAMPADLLDQRHVTITARPTGDATAWPGGEHSARCWVLLDHPITTSLYGLGDLPTS
ncbi:septum formation family protein [Dactylosporangium vinaceum]|uniref:Septum formation family protein n=1 Tax=Dactylosporangium vinaceum TaxID=53362 RepID=A0ABV5MN26_9ACTN|nr:septum formation family protein [Dactylosporangium vinaceum]UAB92319.1 septum formation family protein [Dactylosporangium vinaceum]